MCEYSRYTALTIPRYTSNYLSPLLLRLSTQLSEHEYARKLTEKFVFVAFSFTIGSGANKWIIYLQGGGWCFNEANCRSRSGGELGSSNSYPATISLGGMLSDSTAANPDFANWNRVYLPYCSGDLHTGTRQTNSSETWGLYFAGHHLFNAALDMLDEAFRLRSATEIILAGGSAGAVGSWIHAESVATRYPSARVVNLPNAGYFTFEQLYPAGDLIDRSAFLRNQSSVWSSYLPDSCSSRISSVSDKWTCLLYVFEAPSDPGKTPTSNSNHTGLGPQLPIYLFLPSGFMLFSIQT